MRRRSAEWTAGVLLSIVLVVLYALLLLFPLSWEAGGANTGLPRTITINTARGAIDILTFWTSAVAAIGAIWIVVRKNRAGWLLLALSLASPVLLFIGAINDAMGFASIASIKDSDGAEYCFLAQSFLQGSALALGRVRRQAGFLQEIDILATAPWERAFGCLGVVRPQNATGEQSLYLTNRRMLVGVTHESIAFIAYDLKGRKSYGWKPDGGAEVASDIRELSPFLLLGPTEKPRMEDFKKLLSPETDGRADAEVVRKEFTNPNPAVATLARRLFDDLKKHPPSSG